MDALQRAAVSETASDRQNLENTQAASQAELPEREPEGDAAPVPEEAPEAPAAEAAASAPAEAEAPVVPPPAPPPPAPSETPGPPASFSSAPTGDPTKPPVPERVGPPIDASAETADRTDRVADGEGPPTAGDGKPALSNQFETPSGADWFLKTGNPAPAREDMGGELTGDPTLITAPVAKPTSPAALLMGGLAVIGLCCMAALALLVWLIFG